MSVAGYQSVVSGGLDNLPTLNSRLVRIFISSTFTDTREERNLLLEDVYPRLKSHCKEQYGMDFQLVDMRWGVPVESSDDHQAAELCMQEITNCQKLSTGPNFVAFLNQKHGYRPLQSFIPTEEFYMLTSCLREHGKSTSLLETWYLKDRNAIPSFFVLQPISSIIPGYKDRANTEAAEEWESVFQQLRDDLKFASKICCKKDLMTEETKHKYFMSANRIAQEEMLQNVAAHLGAYCLPMFHKKEAYVDYTNFTEAEIYNGILKLYGDVMDHCLCFVRIIQDIDDHLDHSKAPRFIDMLSSNDKRVDVEAQVILSQLRDEKLTRRLQNINLQRNFVKWSEKDGINRLDHKAYLNAFKESFYQSVIALIDKAVRKERQLIQDDLYIEVLQHSTMAVERCHLFHGREEILHEIAEYLQSDSRQPLVLYGQSGCGKTSIMAQTAKMVRNIVKKNVAVVLRFLGTSPDSSNLWRLLRSLCLQIAVCYGKDRQSVPEDFDELKDYFIGQLKIATPDQPMIVLLDSLDQLSGENNAYKMNWLPRTLPPNVRFIVSTYTEASDLIGTLRLMFLSTSFIQVPVFSSELSIQVLKSWLQKGNRTLTQEQFSLAEAAFEKCSLPLYVKLIFDQVKAWRSYTPVSEYSLAYTVQNSIDRLFMLLEKKHGVILVSRALAYVTASATGISETELEDLLSLDDVVLTSVYQIHIPPLRRIPPLLWVRIRHDISQYLVDKEVDEVRVFFWYHRQFFETAKKRYLQDPSFKVEIHSLMADYYLGRWHGVKKPFKYTPAQMKKVEASSPDSEADRRIAAQPIIFSQDADGQNVRYNKRKLNKLPFHLYKANRQKELRAICLLNYPWLQHKLYATSIQQILYDYQLFGERESVLHKAIKAALSTLKKFPETLSIEICGRYLALLQTKVDSEEMSLLDESMMAAGKNLHLVPYQHCFSIPSEALMYTLEHHRVPVNPKMAAISNDSAHFAVLSKENDVLIWDLVTGELETSTTLDTPNEESVNVMIKPSGKDILICGVTNQMQNNPVFLVDINTGSLENSLSLEEKYPKLGFSDDLQFEITQNALLVMAVNQAADVFDLKTGKCLHKFEIKPTQMELLANDSLVLFHDKNATSYDLYDMKTYDLIQSIDFEHIPKSISKSPDGMVCGIVQQDKPSILVVSTTKEEMGKVFCKVELSKEKLQDCHIVDDLCLITTMEGFILWDIKSNKKKLEVKIPDNVKPHYRVIDFHGVLTSDKKTILAAYTGYFILWDAMTGKLIHTIKATKSQITKMVISPSGEYVIHASRRNNSFMNWKFASMMNKVREFEPLSMNDSARYLVVNRSGTTALCRSMKSDEFAVIDIEQGIKRCNISKGYEAMMPMLTQDGKYAVLREYESYTALRIWDTHTTELVKTIPISSLNLKGYVLGENSENMAVLTESEITGEHTLSFYEIPSGKSTGIDVPLSKYNMMQIFFTMNDKYCIYSVEEQASPRVKIYAKAIRVSDGTLVCQYDKMHPKLIQNITPNSDCFMGQHVHLDDNGQESWEFVVIKIETGEIITHCPDPPSSVLCTGSIGRYGIDKDRFVYDIIQGKRCFQFDADCDYHDEKLPSSSSRTSPKVSDDEKHAVWLHSSLNLLKVGDIKSQTLISVCPVHSMPMNINITPQRIILIGCEDGRIMMLQLVEGGNTSAFTNIFNRSKKKVLQIRDSVMRTLQPQKTRKEAKPIMEEKSDSEKSKKGTKTSKACQIL